MLDTENYFLYTVDMKNEHYFTSQIIERINSTIENDPEISRTQLSRSICRWLDWKAPNGKLQEMSCRVTLLKLEKKGIIKLPEIKTSYTFNNAKQKSHCLIKNIKINANINELGLLKIELVPNRSNKKSQIWNSLMKEYHPLAHGPLCGRQIRYLISSDKFGYLGGLSFSAPTFRLKLRDELIGWNEAAHNHNLQKVVCNSRFLILPEVTVPNLASHVLSKAIKQLPYDWQERYNYELVLVETFVDSTLGYTGTSYKAANWISIGQTAGRHTAYPNGKISTGKKEIYIYPLKKNWKLLLSKEPEEKLGMKPAINNPEDWVEKELGRVGFYDDRLKLRLYNITRDLFSNPGTLVPQASNGIKAKAKAAYRFFSNPKVEMNKILKPHIETTIDRIKEHNVVLAVQDTTSVNYTSHPKTEGLGPIKDNSNKTSGFFVHDTMAFTQQGIPLGLLDLQCWAREPEEIGKSKKRHVLPIEEKESFKWIKSYRAVSEAQSLCPKTMLVSVGDREADIYELFSEALEKPNGPQLLIRSMRARNRKIEQQGNLWETMSSEPVAGYIEVQIPKKGIVQERKAKLEIRYKKVKLTPPKRKKELKSLNIWAVYAKEIDYSEDIESPVEWMLLTTVETSTFEQACLHIQWYTKRWGIEIYHRTLKSGCRIENRRLRDINRLKNCLAIDLVIAWRIFYLTMQGRQTPDVSCESFLDEEEWKVLAMYKKKVLTSQ